MKTSLLRVTVAALLTTTGLATIASPVAAVTNHTVTTTDDVVAEDGQTSLREAMIAADQDGDDSTITLSPGLTYHLDLCENKVPYENPGGTLVAPEDDDQNADGDLDHGEPYDLTIHGNGATIDQTCPYDRVLHSMNSDTLLVVDNTIIRDGNQAPDPGDNIRSIGSLTLQNGTIITDGWDYSGGGYAVQVGGDMEDQTLVLTISDSNITGNGESGARVRDGVMIVDGALVANNDGHGLVGSFADIQATDSTVTGNEDTGLYGLDSPVSAIGSTISGNGLGISATGNNPGSSPIVVTNTDVEDNTGGGIFCGYCVSITATGSSISDNGETNGPGGSFGGISMETFSVNDGIEIIGSTMDGNRSPGNGGAIRALFDDDFGNEGAPPAIIIDESNLTNNRSGIQKDGGAIWTDEANLTITNGSNLIDNWAKPSNELWGGDGGAIWISRAETVTITDSNLAGNRAQGDGGAVYGRELESINIDATVISENDALGNNGGGLNLFNTTAIAVTDTAILDNRAELSGGGVRIKAFDTVPSAADFNGTAFGRNTATKGNGGGLSTAGDLVELELVNTTVTENEAGGTGGGISIFDRATADFWHLTVAANKAPLSQAANLFHQGEITTYATFIGVGIGGDDCASPGGLMLSLGYNMSGDNSCGLSHWTDDTGVVGVALGPLADNGGPTPTRKPAKTSQLVNVIPVANCIQPLDQRNVGRPLGARCDVGAVEVDGPGGGPDDFKPVPPRDQPPGSVTSPTTPPEPDPGKRRS